MGKLFILPLFIFITLTVHPQALDNLAHANELADEEAEEEAGEVEEGPGVPEGPGLQEGEGGGASDGGVIVQSHQDDGAQDHEDQADLQEEKVGETRLRPVHMKEAKFQLVKVIGKRKT